MKNKKRLSISFVVLIVSALIKNFFFIFFKFLEVLYLPIGWIQIIDYKKAAVIDNSNNIRLCTQAIWESSFGFPFEYLEFAGHNSCNFRVMFNLLTFVLSFLIIYWIVGLFARNKKY